MATMMRDSYQNNGDQGTAQFGEGAPQGYTRTSNYIGGQPGQVVHQVGGPVVRQGTPTRYSSVTPGAQSQVYTGQGPTIMTQTTISNVRPSQYNSMAYQG